MGQLSLETRINYWGGGNMPGSQISQGSIVVLVEREGPPQKMLTTSLSKELTGGLAEMVVRKERFVQYIHKIVMSK
jgi:hypothetical protein